MKGLNSFQELLTSVSYHALGNLDHSSQGKLEKVYKRVNLWANLSEHRLQETIRMLSYGDLRVYAEFKYTSTMANVLEEGK